MDEKHPNVPDHDPAASSMPRIPLPQSAGVPEVVRDRYDEADGVVDPTERLIDALDRALVAAIDLGQPRLTAAKCLTLSARVAVGRRNGPEWLTDQLDQLIAKWRTEAEAPPCE